MYMREFPTQCGMRYVDVSGHSLRGNKVLFLKWERILSGYYKKKEGKVYSVPFIIFTKQDREWDRFLEEKDYNRVDMGLGNYFFYKIMIGDG